MSRKGYPRRFPHARKLSFSGSVFRIDPCTVVKTGDHVLRAEAEVMRFVRENTTIPVPKVHFTYRDEETGCLAIVMEYIEGDTLHAVWEDYTDAQKNEVIAQLRDYMQQLRQCKGTFIGAIDGTCCNDAYFCGPRAGHGPFPAEPEFNEAIMESLQEDCSPAFIHTAKAIWRDCMKNHESVLTHNDLDPRNILVDGTKIVGILDWEFAGYYPEYWEYCMAMRNPCWEDPWMVSWVYDRILEPYTRELSVVWSTNNAFG